MTLGLKDVILCDRTGAIYEGRENLNPSKEAIAKVLTDEPKLAAAIAEEVGISTQKASALLRQMEIKVTDVKVKGKGTQKGYSL